MASKRSRIAFTSAISRQLAIEPLLDSRAVRVRPLTREQLPEHHAHRVQIRATVERPAQALLRRHVPGSTPYVWGYRDLELDKEHAGGRDRAAVSCGSERRHPPRRRRLAPVVVT